MDIYRVAVPPRDLKLVLGGSRHLYTLNLCPLSCCSTLAIISLGYCPPIQVVVFTVSRGLSLEFAFLEDVDIGVTAYCLPEDETIGEFGYLLQLFRLVYSV